jgi:hypothetical protein
MTLVSGSISLRGFLPPGMHNKHHRERNRGEKGKCKDGFEPSLPSMALAAKSCSISRTLSQTLGGKCA